VIPIVYLWKQKQSGNDYTPEGGMGGLSKEISAMLPALTVNYFKTDHKRHY
jgi:hypothetical protein